MSDELMGNFPAFYDDVLGRVDTRLPQLPSDTRTDIVASAVVLLWLDGTPSDLNIAGL